MKGFDFMINEKIAGISSIISTMTEIVGIIFFFSNPTITIFCAIVSWINSFLQSVYGGQRTFNTEIATIVISAVIAVIIKKPVFSIICFGTCIGSLLCLFFGWILMLFFYNKKF